MSVLFELKKKYCWLNEQILLILVSYEDHRCYQTPNRTHVCFWEGDFQCLFEVYKVDSQKHSCQWLKTILLNDHDHKNNKWTPIVVPEQKQTYILFLSGGPQYASGYKETNNLRFEISFRRQ